LLATQIRLYASPEHIQDRLSAGEFVTHEFPVDQVDEAMAQAFDIDAS
jgi:hypothetical protein